MIVPLLTIGALVLWMFGQDDAGTAVAVVALCFVVEDTIKARL